MIKVAIKMSEFVLQFWCKSEALIIPYMTYDNKTTLRTNLDRIIWRKSQFFQRYKNISDHFLLQSAIAYLCRQPANRSVSELRWKEMAETPRRWTAEVITEHALVTGDSQACLKSCEVVSMAKDDPALTSPALLWQQPRQTPGGFQSGQAENVAGLLPGCSVQDVIVRNTVVRFFWTLSSIFKLL